MFMKLTDFFKTAIVMKTCKQLVKKTFLSYSQFCYTTWFFSVKAHLFKLLLKSDKGSVEQLLPDVISRSLNNDYKKDSL